MEMETPSDGLLVYDVAMIHASRVFELRIETRFEVLFQKRVRVFHHGFQTRENR